MTDEEKVTEKEEDGSTDATTESDNTDAATKEDTKPAKKATKKTASKVEKPAADKVVKEEPADEVLVRMVRRNPKMEVSGPSGKRYLFTQAHPFQVVTAEDADHLRSLEGFEIASPGQAESFYS